MVDIPINELRSMSCASIEGLINRCREELERRRNAEREKLITDFRKAWGALKDAGIDVRYLDEYEYEQDTYLRDWECFCFD